MRPDCRRWTERMIAQWSARAAALQEDPEASAATLLRAACLEDLVRDLRRRLAASPEPTAEEALRAEWRAALAVIQPYRHPAYGIMFNQGEIMDRLRWRYEDRLGLPRSAATGRWQSRPKWANAPIAPPAADPAPFTAGPQMDMFG
ncbi:hypothetical protein [Sphingomonas sp. YL-JM2C]